MEKRCEEALHINQLSFNPVIDYSSISFRKRGTFKSVVSTVVINRSLQLLQRYSCALYCTHRGMCTELTHIDKQGKMSMVNVGGKNLTKRIAMARAKIFVGPEIAALIAENNIKKGDVLTISRLAGVLAAKQTSNLIPLCHNIILSHIDVTAELVGENVVLVGRVQTESKTGVEMEALTGVTVAALTVYDMCKAVSKTMVITEVKLLYKSGGVKGDYSCNEE